MKNERERLFENVTYRYLESDVEAVSDIQFSVPKSQWLSIVGRNGSGKSTIGKLMNMALGKTYMRIHKFLITVHLEKGLV